MVFHFVGVKSKAYCISADSFSEVSGTSWDQFRICFFFFMNSNHRLKTLSPKKIPIVLFKQLENCLILKNDIFPKLHRGGCKRADPKPWRIQLASVLLSRESPAIRNIFGFKRLILTSWILCYLSSLHLLLDRQNLDTLMIQSLPRLWHYSEQWMWSIWRRVRFETNPDRLQSSPFCRIGSHESKKLRWKWNISSWACAL